MFGLVASVAAALVGSCSGSIGDARDIEDPIDQATVSTTVEPDGADTSTTPSSDPTTTTTTEAVRPPSLTVEDRLVAGIGTTSSFSITASAVDGGDVELTADGLPPDARLDGSTLEWRPPASGSWDVTITATDTDGASVSETVEMAARWPRRDDLLVALGDSVAAGHGLDALDYLGLDPCFRADGAGYPRRVADGLALAGSLPAPIEVGVVACTGATASQLLGTPVRAAIPGLDVDGPLTQVDWAVRSNPGYVVLTVGANDARFTEPSELVGDDGLDEDGLDERLAGFGDELGTILDRLVTETDARIVVTTYHNPVADDPNGVEGCTGECFRDAVAGALGRLGDAIGAAVDDQPADRVTLADLGDTFAGHGAGRRLGADLLSQNAEGAIADLVRELADLTDPYCSAGASPVETWVSVVDCVHPDAAGVATYAEVVLDALATP